MKLAGECALFLRFFLSVSTLVQVEIVYHVEILSYRLNHFDHHGSDGLDGRASEGLCV